MVKTEVLSCRKNYVVTAPVRDRDHRKIDFIYLCEEAKFLLILITINNHKLIKIERVCWHKEEFI